MSINTKTFEMSSGHVFMFIFGILSCVDYVSLYHHLLQFMRWPGPYTKWVFANYGTELHYVFFGIFIFLLFTLKHVSHGSWERSLPKEPEKPKVKIKINNTIKEVTV